METKDKLRLLYDISFSYNTIKDFVENNYLLSIDEFDNVMFDKTYLMINKNNNIEKLRKCIFEIYTYRITESIVDKIDDYFQDKMIKLIEKQKTAEDMEKVVNNFLYTECLKDKKNIMKLVYRQQAENQL